MRLRGRNNDLRLFERRSDKSPRCVHSNPQQAICNHSGPFGIREFSIVMICARQPFGGGVTNLDDRNSNSVEIGYQNFESRGRPKLAVGSRSRIYGNRAMMSKFVWPFRFSERRSENFRTTAFREPKFKAQSSPDMGDNVAGDDGHDFSGSDFRLNPVVAF